MKLNTIFRLLLIVALLASVVLGEATTPRIKGRLAVARSFLQGKRTLWIGDSIAYQNADRLYRHATGVRQGGWVRNYHFEFSVSSGGNWSSGNNLDGVLSDPLSITVARSVDFLGGTSGANSNHLSNRVYSGTLGVTWSAATPIYNSSRMASVFAAGDWITETLAAGHDVGVRMWFWRHPGGPQNANLYLQARNSSTVLDTSDFFSGYAEVATWDYIEAVIPAGTNGPFTDLNIDIRFRANTATEAGTKFVFSSKVEVYDKTEPGGLILNNVGIGGASVDDWIDTNDVTPAVLEYLVRWQPEVILITLGQNNPQNNTASQHAAKVQQLIERFNNAGSFPDIILVPNAATIAGTGGEDGEQYQVTGYGELVDDHPRYLLLNAQRALPPYAAQDFGWRATWSDMATGQQIYANQVVRHGSSHYAAKTDHTKGSTNPADDTTNWQVINSLSGLQSRPTADHLNPFTSDLVHTNPAGADIWAGTLMALAREAATRYQSRPLHVGAGVSIK